MKVNFCYYTEPNVCYNKSPVFGGLKIKKQSLYDLFIHNPVGYYTPKKSLNKIKNVRPQCLAGTKCDGSIPLRYFWDFFYKDKSVKNCGYSTNTEGFGDSFLIAEADKPISTSAVYDCSVMYLFNKNTRMHALYHAMPNCNPKRLQFIIKTLMPEGVTMGAIIPGDSLFYKEQERNMKNMLKLLSSAGAIVNVFHSRLRYPEIAGVNGEVYEIPNIKVQKQINNGILEVDDFGQATFKIVDLQGCNTFENIKYNGKTEEDLNKLEKCFLKAKYPKEILKILFNEIKEKKKEILK